MKQEKEPVLKSIARNRKVHQRFSILEAFEAGIALLGHEVKSLRQGQCSIEEGFVRIENGQMALWNVHIPPYSHLTHGEYQPTRTRKLLMHRREIAKLSGQVQAKGLALVPLELYFKKGKAKLAVGLAKSKRSEDRREEIKKREVDRDIRRKLSR